MTFFYFKKVVKQLRRNTRKVAKRRGENTSYLKSNATEKAAAAARAPISITLKAPDTTGTPVTLLLKYPNTNKQIKVAITEKFNASLELLIKK